MKPIRKTRIAVSIAASLGLTGAAVAKPPQGMPQAKFSWSMAERTRAVENVDFKPEITSVRHFMIEGPVAGQPGLFGGVSSVPLDQINPPDGYEVSFDGCASTGDIQQYQWRVDGKRIPGNATRCTVTTRLPEGVHEVELLVKNKGRKSTVTQTVEIKDYLIVIMGDSYSSGEGNATRYDGMTGDDAFAATLANDGAGWSEGAYWDYANCHRSTRSGQANAAIDLERADPHSSVTTLYLACSGAQIDSGILGIKDGYLGAPEKPQTLLAYQLAIANGRDIDAVTLGIGGNDIGFVPVVAEGALQEDAFLSTELSAVRLINPNLPLTDTSPLSEDELSRLVLTPSDEFPDAGVPGLPANAVFRTLTPATLHACDSLFQRAAFEDGGIGPAESCRESIGTTEFGLTQVDACLTGDGVADCRFARTYYNFDEAQWKYPDAASVPGHDIPASWPGLGVDPSRVFYTEYPDLTTEFARGSAEGDDDEQYKFCSISIDKGRMILLLRAIKPQVDNPELIDAIIAGLQASGINEFGLAQNEFQWAAQAVLNGFADPMDRALLTALTGKWKAPKEGVGASWLIGSGEAVEDIRYGKGGDVGPALNEMTLLSGGRYGWTPVIGTHDLASGHGLCTAQPDGSNDAVAAYAYLVGGLPETTNVSGSAHPNLLGQEAYRTPLALALQAALLPQH